MTVDLRSDTVTRPSMAMRQAMFDAEVGDDVLSEDPTVRRLEQRAAELTGKEAAVFVASGTMGNQAAMQAHLEPGQEVICDENSHIVLYEFGGVSRFVGALVRSVPTAAGILSWDDIAARLRGPSDHYRGTGLIAVENTHNMAGGRVYPLDRLQEIGSRAKEAGVKVHMDGARVFSAAAALEVPVAEVVAPVDSVTFCLSKNLGAPVGSVVAGAADFIERARLARKALGGGMRQVGVIAATGLVAIEETPPLLARDHANAKFLAQELAAIDRIEIAPDDVETNILFFRVSKPDWSAERLRAALREDGVLVSGLYGRIRMVTHRDVDRKGCESAIAAVKRALG